MEVDLKRSERQTGMIFKKTEYKLEAVVEISDEEIAGLKKNNLKDEVLIVQQYDPKHQYEIPISTLWTDRKKDGTTTYVCRFSNAGERAVWEQEFIDQLKRLKTYLEAESNIEESTRVEI